LITGLNVLAGVKVGPNKRLWNVTKLLSEYLSAGDARLCPGYSTEKAVGWAARKECATSLELVDGRGRGKRSCADELRRPAGEIRVASGAQHPG